MLFKIFLIILTPLVFLLPAPGYSRQDAPRQLPFVYGSLKNITCPINIKPGIGMGPIKLGQSIAEIEKLGLELKTIQGESTHMIAGPFSIGVNDQGQIHYVEAALGDMPDCIQYNKQKINLNSATQSLVKIFKDCKKEEKNFGGNEINCKGIYIETGGWSGTQKTPALKILDDRKLIESKALSR